MTQTTLPYLTAEQLGIEPWERDGLIALVGPLILGELEYDQGEYDHTCGTALCIGGWLAFRAKRSDWERYVPNVDDAPGHPLHPLFWGNIRSTTSNEQAARAIVNFLTLGDPRWDDVMREPTLTTSNSERAANEEAAAGALAEIERVLAGDLDFDADDSGAMTHVLEEIA